MSKNIIIFSDGTGQAGGITFDEVRTNVYKLYRACRVGPEAKAEAKALGLTDKIEIIRIELDPVEF